MRLLSFTFFILVLFAIGNNSADAIINKIKDGINKMGDTAKKYTDKVMGKATDYFCEHGGNFGVFAGKGFGYIKCDTKGNHGTEEWCNKVGNARDIFDMICILGNEQRQIAMDAMISCFQTKDHNKGQDFLKKWYDMVIGLKDVAQMAANAGK